MHSAPYLVPEPPPAGVSMRLFILDLCGHCGLKVEVLGCSVSPRLGDCSGCGLGCRDSMGKGSLFPWPHLPLAGPGQRCLPRSPWALPVSLGFFDDILIPPESLQQPAKLYPSERLRS